MTWLVGALRQPLPYFLLIGLCVFLVDSWLRETPETIVVSEAVRREVATRLERQASRPPTAPELERELDAWVDTELLFREALVLGLDDSDSVIREHLARKLEHIVREKTVLAEPSQAELEAQFAAHRARYTAQQTFDVTHVFVQKLLSPDTYRQRLDEALSKLREGAVPESVGDHFPRGPKFVRMTELQLQEALAAKLSSKLEESHIGVWQVAESERGAHLFRLDGVSSPNPDFASLSPVLKADVNEAKKQAAVREYLGELKQKYTLASEPPH